MKKLTKTAYYTTNVLLPLFETKLILRTIKYSGSKLAEHARRLKQAKAMSSDEILSFNDAVRESGQSLEALIRRYCTAKRIWLILLGLIGLLALLLPISLILAGVPISGILLSRVISLSFMLVGFGSLMFVRALICQFRLWQLQTRQLGTFAEWRATQTWLRDIFSWRLH